MKPAPYWSICAVLCHLAACDTGPVSKNAVLQALAWGEYLESHARRAYGSISRPGIATAKAILRRIEKGDLPASFTARDIYRHNWSKLADREQVAEGLQLLVDYGHLREERVETSGRPATIYHVVKP